MYLVIPIHMQQDHLPYLLGRFAVILPTLRDFFALKPRSGGTVSLRTC